MSKTFFCFCNCLIVQLGLLSILAVTGDAQARKGAEDECFVVTYFADKTINFDKTVEVFIKM